MNDLMMHLVNLKEHILHIWLVLQHLHKHKLGMKLEKYIIYAPQIEYLGLIIGEGQISMKPVKLKAMNDWNPPCPLV